MGWFDEQIRQRMLRDDEAFSDAFAGMADAIMGERLSKMLADERQKTKSAVDEILRYHHVKPQELPDDITGVMNQLEYLLRPSGMMWRSVNLEDAWYKDAVGAFLGTRSDDGSAVALIPGKFSGYTFFDAASGKRLRVNKKTAGLIDNQALCFYMPFPQKAMGVKDLLLYILQNVRVSDLTVIGLATLLVTLVGLLPPYLNKLIYGAVIEMGSLRLLISVATFLICVLFSQTLISVFNDLITRRLSTKMDVAFEAAGMARVLSLPPAFFRQYGAGDLASRLGNVGVVCSTLSNAVLSVGLGSLFSLVYVAQMMRYGPGLVVPGLLVILATIAASIVSTLVQVKHSERIMKATAAEAGLSYQLVAGVQKIKLAGAEKRAFARWAKSYTPVARLNYDPPLPLKLSSLFATCVGMVGTLVIYFFTIETKVPLADYYAFQSAYGMVMGAFTALIGTALSFAQLKPSMKMIEPLLKTVPEASANRKPVTSVSGAIEMSNVTFRYAEDMPPVIDNLSLKIKPGQYVAIVGRTGCGKSTLLRLLLGFETPQKGAVYYDGKDLTSLDQKSLRRKIGVVMQNGKLFSGDIFSNITISAPWLTMEDAWKAAEQAGIAEDIRQMPMGMHTIISEGSGGVSGGQRQRLMIARAIAPGPKILMFDEATSALDNITQRIVSDSLDKLKCTRIVIAHRLSTIRQCDRILVLDKGKIIEDGGYEALIERDGVFAELVARQRLDDDAYVAKTTLF